MKINKLTIAFATLALTGIAGGAFAETKDVEKPIRILVGTYMPSNSTFKNNTGKNWTSFGVSYDLGKTKSDKPWIYSLFVDNATKKRGTVNNTITGIGLSARYLLGTPSASAHTYLIGGVGSYRAKSGQASQSKVGFKLGGGYELSNGFFGEVAAVQPGVKNTNGIEARLGFRF
jgi:hypothetical protein